jgi:hypothetical protein
VTLHIDRLVLDGIDLASGQEAAVEAAIEHELTRLLTEAHIAGRLSQPTAQPLATAPALALGAPLAPAALGCDIASAIVRGIGA